MYIDLDLSVVPPISSLRDADDFERFTVVANRPSHVFVRVEELRRLAGERDDDPEWQAKLAGMIAYAESKGWVGEDGTVRAHVEWRD